MLKAVFTETPGKGSHRVFRLGKLSWVLSGQMGDDADKYQEQAVKKLLRDAKEQQKGGK